MPGKAVAGFGSRKICYQTAREMGLSVPSGLALRRTQMNLIQAPFDVGSRFNLSVTRPGRVADEAVPRAAATASQTPFELKKRV
jgi:hypothetical protein